MEYWEFLLQKEGDQSWLPLDASQVEILEGRYRVMAHTSQTHIPVQILISQWLLDRTPPKRRVQRRQGQVNGDGLMVVMPFTRLGAGTWDIHCVGPTPEAASDGEGSTITPWRYAIQLQVVAQDAGDDDDWFADEGMPPGDFREDATGTGAIDPTPPDASSDIAGVQTQSSVPAWPSLNLDEVVAALDRVQARQATLVEAQPFLYTVTLNQTALIGSQGQPLEIGGQVTGVLEGESCSDMALVVGLSDPQRAQRLAIQPFVLGASALPAQFTVAVTVPAELTTRLLVGEVGLVSVSAGTVSVLTLQPFTVTVDLSLLFDAIANQAEIEATLNGALLADGSEATTATLEDLEETTDTATPSRWTTIALPQAPPRAVPTLTLPRSSLNLPPKIYYPSPHEAAAHRPVLPPLGSPPKARVEAPRPTATTASPALTDPSFVVAQGAPPAALTTSDTRPESPPNSAADPPGSDSPPPAEGTPSPAWVPTQSAPGPALPPLNAPVAVELPPPDPLEGPSPTMAGASNRPRVPLLPSHEAMAFRDLRLQDRFWARLNDLALEIQQAARQKRNDQAMAKALATPYIDADDEEAEWPVEVIPFAGEVVIYDDEDETLGASLTASASSSVIEPLDHDTDVVAPPIPVLEIAEGELTAGAPVLITLRVPFHPNRLYLKVWITDPQTRSLADEPRQVMNLSPNGRGQLEGSLQLTVPLGCLEAQFEAIAVDLITQQESYKASVSRTITPAGMPTPAFDEFEL
ncbi:MAG: hypothetical protein ACFCVD_07850 [Nodosilinea sp.]